MSVPLTQALGPNARHVVGNSVSVRWLRVLAVFGVVASLCGAILVSPFVRDFLSPPIETNPIVVPCDSVDRYRGNGTADLKAIAHAMSVAGERCKISPIKCNARVTPIGSGEFVVTVGWSVRDSTTANCRYGAFDATRYNSQGEFIGFLPGL